MQRRSPHGQDFPLRTAVADQHHSVDHESNRLLKLHVIPSTRNELVGLFASPRLGIAEQPLKPAYFYPLGAFFIGHCFVEM